MCGEKRSWAAERTAPSGSPPRVRGKVATIASIGTSGRITPACAGKRILAASLSKILEDHPRVCGEKLWVPINPSALRGSPPRVRGKAVCRDSCRSILGITPACAGKSALNVTGLSASHGSPPRVRGKGGRPPLLIGRLRITPACAGKRLKRSQYKAIFSIQHRVIPLVLNKVEAP